ncbi:glycine betaine ABC transporter substrate-binding protein [Escherichia coli]
MLAAVSLPLAPGFPLKSVQKSIPKARCSAISFCQVLESHGVPTVNKVQLGATARWCAGAITSGELDIYPEYTGNGAFFFKDENDAAWKNAQQGYEKVKKPMQSKTS